MSTFNTNYLRRVHFVPRSSDRHARRVWERLKKSLRTRHGLMAFGVVLLVARPGVCASDVREATDRRAAEFLSENGELLPADWRAQTGVMTFLVVHGFRDTGTSEESLRQARAIRQRFERDNVVIVSWRVPNCPDPAASRKGDSFFGHMWQLASDYAQAVDIARRVGREIGDWMNEKQISPESTVISGHSLGAQIAAFASNACALPELFGAPVRAILAADPAGPLFEGRLPAERLDPSDAQEVIVVHTTDMLGVKSAVGTVDTYVSWPASKNPDTIARHSFARELVTDSFLAQGLAHSDGTPFGANAVGVRFPDQNPKTYRAGGAANNAIAAQ